MKNRKQKIKNLILLGILILLINAINSLALPVPRGVDGIIYDLEGNQISGAFFSVNDTVTGQFTQGITGSYGSPGRYSVSINGEDSDLIIIRAWNQYHNTSMQVLLEGVMHKINLYLNTTMPNNAPEIISTPVTQAIANYNYTYDVDAYDPDLDTLSYSLLLYPVGMTINETSGLIEWVPTIAQAGNHTVIVMVTDGKLNDIQEYIVNVDYKNYQFGGNTNLYSTSIGPDLSKNLNPIISKINVPFKISGTIFKLPEIQARAGTSVKIENLNSNEVIETKTGLGPNSGAFYSLVYGDENDLIRITVGKKELFTKLKDTNIDIILNKSTFSYITSFLSLIIKSNYAIIFAIILLPVLLLCKVKKHFKEIKKNKEK